ncbi:MAG: anthranilate synthase component I [Spirochaetes bacterium]|nr:MAG: anthranilate synthase component I [Spirochaetota bacterium]
MTASSIENAEGKVLTENISGENYTPYGLFKKLNGIALFESASFGKGKGRYSIIMLRDAFSVFQVGKEFFLKKKGKIYKIKTNYKDILDVCSRISKQHRDINYPFPFPAGGMGYIGYEYAKYFDTIALKDKKANPEIPEAWFIFGHSFLIFDHYNDSITILIINYNENRIDPQKELKRIKESLYDLNFNYLKPESENYNSVPLNMNEEHESFLKGVKIIRREIIKGNILQAVLSRRLYIHTKLPAIEAYRRLRSINPSPYMFLIDFKDFQIFGSSPELHVKVIGNRVIMRPIAGTRPRGKNEEEDKKLEKELLNDEKERAEHLMLVDLVRNDLGRICKPGSVEVTDYYSIERYSHVMHIVSQVEGNLRKDIPPVEAIRKTFPAGTVSGAPKIAAMEILDSMEKEKRGFYAGIVGYLEPSGNLDTCISIRSALKSNDIMILQAGAGIVYDSIPEKEYQETSSKLKALGKSIGMEV